MLPEMIAGWAICIGCARQFFRPLRWWRNVAALCGFIYFGINFVLCLYPPYQIPLCWLAFALLGGVALEERRRTAIPCGGRGILWIGAGVLAIGLLLLPFWFKIYPTLELVAHTAYPGGRRSHGGDLSCVELFSGLVGFFEAEQVHPGIYDNICEASNFYPLWVAVALAVVVARVRQKVKLEPLVTLLGIFLAAFSVYCVTPLPPWFLRSTLVSFTTESRALLAIGLANIFFCCLFFDRYRGRIFSWTIALSLGLALACGLVALGYRLKAEDSRFFLEDMHLSVTLAVNGVFLLLFFAEPLRKWLPPVLVTLFVFSSAGINPIMRGLAPLIDTAAFRQVSRLHAADPTGKWIVYDSRYFAQLVKATGAPIFNGTKILPDLPFLHRFDPDPPAHEYIYNRYANIGCDLPDKDTDLPGAGLLHPDFYIWFLPPDHPALRAAGYRYALFPSAWPGAKSYGFSLIEKIEQAHLWIYRLNEVSLHAR